MSTLEYIELRDNLLMRLLKTRDIQTLERIKNVLDSNPEEDFFDELPKEIQNSLLKSIEQVKNGELIPHEEVMKKYKKD